MSPRPACQPASPPGGACLKSQLPLKLQILTTKAESFLLLKFMENYRTP